MEGNKNGKCYSNNLKGNSRMDYKKNIKITPGKRSGKPCIRDTRITVYDILEMLANRMSIEKIVDDFPELTEQDIYSCLAFAADREHNQLIIFQ
jgi:uncharacterized protein (DUF433 family)